jgi:predicted small metal-binding protein
MKRIHCGDLVPGCTFVARAASEADVLHEEARHAREMHGLEVTPAFLERARSRIRDAEAPAAQAEPRASHPG